MAPAFSNPKLPLQRREGKEDDGVANSPGVLGRTSTHCVCFAGSKALKSRLIKAEHVAKTQSFYNKCALLLVPFFFPVCSMVNLNLMCHSRSV